MLSSVTALYQRAADLETGAVEASGHVDNTEMSCLPALERAQCGLVHTAANLESCSRWNNILVDSYPEGPQRVRGDKNQSVLHKIPVGLMGP